MTGRRHELTPERLAIIADYVSAAWLFSRERDQAVTVHDVAVWWMAHFGWPGPEDGTTRYERNLLRIVLFVRDALPPSLRADDVARADATAGTGETEGGR